MAQTNQAGFQLNSFVDTQTKRSYFTILATLILLIVLVLLIYPAIQHITKVNKEIEDARLVKASLEEKISNLETAKINLEEVREDLALLDLALPLGSDLTPYIQKVESLAKKYKLEISALQFTNVPLSIPAPADNLHTRSLDYNVTFEGSFTNFRKLVAALEDYIRISDLKDIRLSKVEKNVLEQLSITTYYIGLELKETTTTTTGSRGSNE